MASPPESISDAEFFDTLIHLPKRKCIQKRSRSYVLSTESTKGNTLITISQTIEGLEQKIQINSASLACFLKDLVDISVIAYRKNLIDHATSSSKQT